MSRFPEDEPLHRIDLHGRRPEAALRYLAQELHAARVRGATEVLVITGRGWGNHTQTPVLRPRVESWLAGSEGRRLGVTGVRVVSKGGALEVRL